MSLMIDRIRGHSFIGTLLPQHGQVVDLGMNQGHFSYEVQRRYGCKILGVEANPELVPEIAGSETLRPLNYAIGPSGQEVSFYIDPENSEASSLTPREGKGRTVSVPSITLPELLALGGIEQIDLLKIDIEGAEIELLQSTPAATLLQARQISVEFHAFMGHGSMDAIVGILARLDKVGFEAIDFSRTHEDVLFINRHSIQLSRYDRMRLLYHKYRLGVARMTRRRWRGSPRTSSGG